MTSGNNSTVPTVDGILREIHRINPHACFKGACQLAVRYRMTRFQHEADMLALGRRLHLEQPWIMYTHEQLREMAPKPGSTLNLQHMDEFYLGLPQNTTEDDVPFIATHLQEVNSRLPWDEATTKVAQLCQVVHNCRLGISRPTNDMALVEGLGTLEGLSNLEFLSPDPELQPADLIPPSNDPDMPSINLEPPMTESELPATGSGPSSSTNLELPPLTDFGLLSSTNVELPSTDSILPSADLEVPSLDFAYQPFVDDDLFDPISQQQLSEYLQRNPIGSAASVINFFPMEGTGELAGEEPLKGQAQKLSQTRKTNKRNQKKKVSGLPQTDGLIDSMDRPPDGDSPRPSLDLTIPDNEKEEDDPETKEEFKHRLIHWIAQMMFVSGETAEPSTETTGLIEEILTQATALANRRGVRSISTADLIFLIRHDKGKVSRLKTFLSWKDVRKNVKDSDDKAGGDSGDVDFEDGGALPGAGPTDTKKTAGSANKKAKLILPWEAQSYFSEQVPEREDEEDNEEEEEQNEATLARLASADERTRNMTRDEYVFWSDCRQASFTFRKGKRFREWAGFGVVTDSKPNDDIVDILGFLTFEIVQTLTEEALKVKASEDLETASAIGAGEASKKRKANGEGGGLFEMPEEGRTPVEPKHIREAYRRLQAVPRKYTFMRQGYQGVRTQIRLI